ncbi:carboxypeptidase-like regulatory domain-containing protein [Acidipila sp. EB88]|uniref:carboxypeptidase-like regulatory domain-containing protein n=1 Tax=Acidipila sp. EB88 TaxID=2305226 RepID=UPI001315202D|nr:carboxypeptidase-like regulatory domain-containing protein [Acidipila sp. EB88]
MIDRTSRFVGLAVTFVVGAVATSSLSRAQTHEVRAGATVNGSTQRSGIAGVVRDRSGQPQVGALIELLDSEYDVLARTFTDDRGRYTLPRLPAGKYQLKASNTLFLPTIHPDLRVVANSRIIINLTLSTLYDAVQWLPATPRTPATRDDDWNWTLRLSANRPLLRMLEADQAAQARLASVADRQEGLPRGIAGSPAETGASARRHGRFALHSGVRQFGESGLSEQALWNSTLGDTRSLMLAAESSVGSAAGGTGYNRLSATAAMQQQLAPGRSMTTVATFTDRPELTAGGASGLAMLRVRTASTIPFGDLGDVEAGTELAAASFGGGSLMAASHPFVRARVHGSRTAVGYSMATAPGLTSAGQLEAYHPGDAPMLTRQAGALHLEQGLHQELRVERILQGEEGSSSTLTGTIAIFHDRLAHPVVEAALGATGDEAALDSDNVLYDPASGTIAVSGKGYSGGGVLALLRDQLSRDTWISLRYALGEAVTLGDAGGKEAAALPVGDSFNAAPASMLAVEGETRVGVTGTVVHGGYRWQPVSTLTQVAPFEAATPEPYLSLQLRQPLHLQRMGTGRLEAILDVRNLLAQGYRPFVSQDGTTVYFAQAQRCLAAGLAFSF